MEDAINLEDWEFLSDSETNSFNFEDIIQPDYFALDSSKPFARPQPQSKSHLGLQEIEKRDSFLADDSKLQVDFQGAEHKATGELTVEEIAKSYSFRIDDTNPQQNSFVVDPKDEFGVGETHKVDALSEEIAKECSFYTSCAQLDVDNIKDELGSEETNKGDTFCQEIEPILQNTDEIRGLRDSSSEVEDEKSRELSSDISAEASNSESVLSGDGERKVVAWWKVPLEIIKMCAFRAKTVWSIPIAAAVIGILMVGRNLYRMKHKSRRIPLKVSFEDKKAASRVLLRAARLNEIVVSHVPIARSPQISAPGVTPWPVVGLLL